MAQSVNKNAGREHLAPIVNQNVSAKMEQTVPSLMGHVNVPVAGQVSYVKMSAPMVIMEKIVKRDVNAPFMRHVTE